MTNEQAEVVAEFLRKIAPMYSHEDRHACQDVAQYLENIANTKTASVDAGGLVGASRPYPESPDILKLPPTVPDWAEINDSAGRVVCKIDWVPHGVQITFPS